MNNEMPNQEYGNHFKPDYLTSAATSALQLAARLQANSVRTGLEAQNQALTFARHRYERDVELANELMKQKSPEDAASIYFEFLQTAFDDYSNEAIKFGNLGAQLAASFIEKTSRAAAATESAVEDEAATMPENLPEHASVAAE